MNLCQETPPSLPRRVSTPYIVVQHRQDKTQSIQGDYHRVQEGSNRVIFPAKTPSQKAIPENTHHSINMPPVDDSKRKAARETIDILYEISTLLVSLSSSIILL